ncbi:MAG: tetratricopeptide repeat protein, partial [Dehalococcoidia bacterium]
MGWLLAFGPQILDKTSRVLLWVPRRLHLVKQAKKDAEREGILWFQRYRESLEKQLTKETDPTRIDNLKEEIENAIAAERGYYRRMIEVSLERSGLPPYDALMANGKRILEPENKAKLTEAVARLELLPPPSTAEQFMASATANYALEQYDEALADYNRALELRPDYPEALNNRGVTYSKMERYDEALADYNRALELRHDYLDALNNRGSTYHLM